MSPRTTRNIALGLVGSAALLTLFLSCSNTDDPQQQAYAGGHSTTHGSGRGYYRRSHSPWFFGGWGSSHSSRSALHSSAPSSGRSSTGSRSSGSATSRGGFGGSGHAHSSGG